MRKLKGIIMPPNTHISIITIRLVGLAWLWNVPYDNIGRTIVKPIIQAFEINDLQLCFQLQLLQHQYGSCDHYTSRNWIPEYLKVS